MRYDPIQLQYDTNIVQNNCDKIRYDTIRYDTIRYDTIRLFSHVSGFLIHYSHLQGTITAKAFEHSQSKSPFFFISGHSCNKNI